MIPATKRCPALTPLLLLLASAAIPSASASLSFGWPSFLGGGGGDATVTPAPPPLSAGAAPSDVPFHIAYQYPIWRVHKYNGIHLKPVDASQLPAVYQQQAAHDFGALSAVPDQTNDIDPRHPNSVAAESSADAEPTADDGDVAVDAIGVDAGPVVATELPTELIEFARSAGITDMSKLPSLEEAMSLLGTTTTDETVSIIKELAATPDGMDLIRQFLQNSEQSSSEEGDISESQHQPSVADVRADIDAAAAVQQQQAAGNQERQLGTNLLGSVDSALDRAHTNLGVLERLVTPPPTAEPPAVPSGGGFFSSIASFFRPSSAVVSMDSITELPPSVSALQPQLVLPQPPSAAAPQPIAQPSFFPNLANIQDSDYDRAVLQYYGRPVNQLRESFQASLPTLSGAQIPADLAQPIAQLRDTFQASFPSLAAGIPQPPPGQLRDSFQATFPTLALPQIPDNTQTPALPVHFNLPNVPQLPVIRIPSYSAPQHGAPGTQPNTRGTYIRVRYPLNGFVPMPQQAPATPNTRYGSPTPLRATIPGSAPAPLNPAHYMVPVPNHSVPSPAAATTTPEPLVFELPRIAAPSAVAEPADPRHPFHASSPNAAAPATAASLPASTLRDVSQLPLTVENYNVFRNAPHVINSYGTAALPYTFPEDDTAAASTNHLVRVSDDMAVAGSAIANEANELLQTEPAVAAPPKPQPQRRGRRRPVAAKVAAASAAAAAAAAVDQTAQRRNGDEAAVPQRITAYDAVATGRLGRRADAGAIAAAIPTQRPATAPAAEADESDGNSGRQEIGHKTNIDVMVRAVNEMTGAAYPPDVATGVVDAVATEASSGEDDLEQGNRQ